MFCATSMLSYLKKEERKKGFMLFIFRESSSLLQPQLSLFTNICLTLAKSVIGTAGLFGTLTTAVVLHEQWKTAHCKESHSPVLCKAAQLNDIQTVDKVRLLELKIITALIGCCCSNLLYLPRLNTLVYIGSNLFYILKLLQDGTHPDDRHQLGWTPLHVGKIFN